MGIESFSAFGCGVRHAVSRAHRTHRVSVSGDCVIRVRRTSQWRLCASETRFWTQISVSLNEGCLGTIGLSQSGSFMTNPAAAACSRCADERSGSRIMWPVLQAGHSLSSCSSISLDVGGSGLRRSSRAEQYAAERQFLSARTVGQKTKLPDAHESARAGYAAESAG